MLRMMRKKQPGSAKYKPNASSAMCTMPILSEWVEKVKSNLKSESWAFLSLLGVLSCDIAIVLTMLAYKKVFNERVRTPLMVICSVIAFIGILYIVASLIIYLRKKKLLYKTRHENSREYLLEQLNLEQLDDIERGSVITVNCKPHQVVAQEIKPGVILGKVVREKEEKKKKHHAKEQPGVHFK